jgi:uncharacterized repeat protein (TIGR02543 family)
MKKALFSITAALIVFAMVITSCDDGSKPNNDTHGSGTEYTVTFNANGGNPRTTDQKVKSGGKATATTPTKTNSDLEGWYKEVELITKWDFDKDTVSADITLYAKWTAKEGYFIVNFNSNGGTNVYSQTVKSGEKANIVGNPTKEGSNFAGWYKESALTTPWDFAVDTVSDNITLYARWVDSNVTVVSLVSVIGNGSSFVTTTSLSLTFNKEITGLAASDITLSGVSGVTNGTLSGPVTDTENGYVYTLQINGVTASGELEVKVEKSGSVISGSPKKVKIMVGGNGTGLTFATAEGIRELTSTSGAIELDPVTGILSCEPTAGWGNYFGIRIPADNLPIASDTFVIKYIGTSNAPVVTKADSTGKDLIPAEYAAFTGNNTVQEKRLPAIRYGAPIPNDYLWFQQAPNDNPPNPWQLKILSITVEHGNPIPVSEGVSKIKPVAGETPVTALGVPGYLQYTGTITWSPTTATFAAGQAYTATITLTKVPGYTFEEIEANDFPVAGAETVTNIAGTVEATTLSITAVFPATAEAAPAKILTFADGDVKGTATSPITILEGSNGYRAVTGGTGYGSAWTYFKVTFAEGLKLSDYTKIDYLVTGVEGGSGSDATGYKAGYMSVFASEAAVRSPAEATLVFTETPGWEATGVGNLGVGQPRTVTVKVQPGTDLNEVWIAFRIGGSAGWTYELKDIKFYN